MAEAEPQNSLRTTGWHVEWVSKAQTEVDVENSQERQQYVRPELRCYGAITRLVQGGSGIGIEGMSSHVVGMSMAMGIF